MIRATARVGGSQRTDLPPASGGKSLTSQKKLAESRDESISAQLAKSLRYGASGDGQGLFGEGSSLNPRANLSEGDIS
jgi:hypothetical protein